jgi:hypothetical protein
LKKEGHFGIRGFMRALHIAILAGLFILGGGGSQPVSATGNVLLPDSAKNTDEPSSGNFNLGLVPRNATTRDTPGLPATGTTRLPLSATTFTSSVPVIPDLPASPHVIKVPDIGPMQNLNNPNLPHSMNVIIANKSVLSSAEISTIHQQLGIPTEKVTSSCRLSLGGFLKTDRGVYLLDTGSELNSVVRYDGQVTGAMLSSKALCDQLPMTPNQGFIMEIGNKYSVPLQGLDCPASAKYPQSLTVFYPGDGTMQCGLR